MRQNQLVVGGRYVLKAPGAPVGVYEGVHKGALQLKALIARGLA